MLQANLYKAFLDGFSSRILLCQDQEEAASAYQLAHYVYECANDTSAQPAKSARNNASAQAESSASSSTDYASAKSSANKSTTKSTKPRIKKPILLPEMRLMQGDDVRSFFVEFIEILACLREFYADDDSLLIAPIYSLLQPLPSPKYCQTSTIELGKSYDLEALKSHFLHIGYEVVDMIEMEGEVSFRGDIIDIYPPLRAPYRISFFDGECDDIREFDLNTQLSKKDSDKPAKLSALTIPPALFSLESSEYEALQNAVSESEYEVLSKDILSLGLWYLQDRITLPQSYATTITPNAQDELAAILALQMDSGAESTQNNTQESALDSTQNATQDSASPIPAFWHAHQIPTLPMTKGYEDIDFRPDALQGLIAHNSQKRLTIIAKNQTILSSLDSALLQNAHIIESSAIVSFITPDELVLSLERGISGKKRAKRPRFALNELNVGEYVVHSDYGIGIFKGIVQNSVLGSVRDFIHIAYFGEDKLLLPVENLHLIDRYIASDDTIPVIDRLGKGSFARMKEKARAKLFEIAESIINLAAKRNLLQGQIMDSDSAELEVFKHACGFDLTPDQESAIDSIMQDMKSGRVMDRLLSGDVGFGKTEVAMNAIFAACRSGYQCALIVPTTLLSAQHYASLCARFAPFGLRVGKLDRFVSAKEKRALLESLKNGEIDVVVGTHSLFGAEFRALGLVVVDEEHKFGVKQKESLKTLSKNVHILSMSATPIPRTLNMALSQIKGMSRLETPPTSRKGSRTFIKSKNDALIKEVIMRELRRGGQVFYIHNNIASIPSLKVYLQNLLPNLSIATLHSQVSASETEEIMRDFTLGKYQILLCTAIIESGIHLPNANTIIIDGADRFGLADLHQLRGRVGRGDKEGFCYFLINDKEAITKEATKRLLALERNSYLGSGARIAYHDLEIRGGGNLIGESQSGHIKNIGYGLYLRLLEDAINTLSGQANIDEKGVELRISVSAYLSPELIASDALRLELYRRLSLSQEVSEVSDIESEIRDRFGALDAMSEAFIQLIVIKILANKKHIKAISHFGQNIQITLESGEKQTLKSPSTDDDDVLATILSHLRQG
ncbi:transcription-repair coupling factor [Helicobacter sp. CLO-3]|uniref:transcription-repair coupling factor n=1 Tax=unclassified Helicobacter TaxID=2593540 RepID=UPI0008051FC5|nr:MULTISPECIES: transcription-repair coupling factor [unclassified Helicobacter]OBV28405.1 transcription-repair coupling factor [Helicobacter sp. CLO-3]OHU85909.1 transcription-repair coupling factor [Helicobacter sp. CLO-3]